MMRSDRHFNRRAASASVVVALLGAGLAYWQFHSGNEAKHDTNSPEPSTSAERTASATPSSPPRANLGPITRCRDLPPVPTDVEFDTTLDVEGGQLQYSYLDSGLGHDTKTFTVDFANDPSCLSRDDTFELINHALEAGNHPVLKKGQLPAHGACSGPTDADVASLVVNPDTPAPICTVVEGFQRLRVVNRTDDFEQLGAEVTVWFAGLDPRKLDVGGSSTLERSFAELIEPGVHAVRFAWNGRSYRAELVLCPPHSRAVTEPSLIRHCRR